MRLNRKEVVRVMWIEFNKLSPPAKDSCPSRFSDIFTAVVIVAVPLLIISWTVWCAL